MDWREGHADGIFLSGGTGSLVGFARQEEDGQLYWEKRQVPRPGQLGGRTAVLAELRGLVLVMT